MGKINWGRVFLGGLVCGVVWGALEAPLLPLVGRDLLAALPKGNAPSVDQPGLLAFLSAVFFVMGIWTMWLYAAIRPRYGPGPKTAAIAGLGVWVMVTAMDIVWALFGVVPPAVLVGPVIAALPVIIVAAMVGAWLYKEA